MNANSEQSVKCFLKTVETTSDIVSLRCLCALSNNDDNSFDIIDILRTNLPRHSIKTQLELLHLVYQKHIHEAHLLYLNIYNSYDLVPRVKLYILDILVRHVITNADMNNRLDYCKSALKINVSDKFVCVYMLTRPYLTSSNSLIPINDLNEHFKVEKYKQSDKQKTTDRINVGFVMPDLNNNGLCMFSYDIVNSLDPKKFDVFVYYYGSPSSYQVQSTKTNNNVTWACIYENHNNTTYHQIHELDKIKVLFDLVSFKSPKIIRLFASRPAPVQVNYLGYLNETHLDCYDSLFEHQRPRMLWRTLSPTVGIDFQPSAYSTNTNQIIIGILNDPTCVSSKCVMTYNAISSKHKNILYIVKSDTKIPKLKNALYIANSTRNLEEYYQLFNGFDYTIDTFPYSGTATTAASLYMGCPVLTFYNSNAQLSSNSSSFMNIDSGMDQFVFNSTSAVLRFKFIQYRDNYHRKQNRKKFLKSMDSVSFMKNFEQTISQASLNLMQ
jgi:predicted O-linked N-acetylglucosamine transferase (SPINDLY family)